MLQALMLSGNKYIVVGFNNNPLAICITAVLKNKPKALLAKKKNTISVF
jgi:hypothetical protein